MSNLKIGREQALDIVYDDNEYFEIIEDSITDTSRWSEFHRIVVKQKATGKFFVSHYTQGLTEQQDESPYEHEDPIFTEVFPVVKEVTVYE